MFPNEANLYTHVINEKVKSEDDVIDSENPLAVRLAGFRCYYSYLKE